MTLDDRDWDWEYAKENMIKASEFSMSKSSWLDRAKSASLGISLMGLPLLWMAPAQAYEYFSENDYRLCAGELQRLDLSPEQIAEACADALEPPNLARCTLRLNVQAQVKATDALEACYRVRQPKDLASCVVDINQRANEAVPVSSLVDHCRRSLLPATFSKCVVGLRRQIDVTLPVALNRCISAEEYPVQLTPTVVPPPASNPTPDFTPLPVPDPVSRPRFPINPGGTP